MPASVLFAVQQQQQQVLVLLNQFFDNVAVDFSGSLSGDIGIDLTGGMDGSGSDGRVYVNLIIPLNAQAGDILPNDTPVGANAYGDVVIEVFTFEDVTNTTITQKVLQAVASSRASAAAVAAAGKANKIMTWPNQLPSDPLLYFVQLPKNANSVVTFLIGFGYGETFEVLALLFCHWHRFRSALYRIAFAAVVLIVANLCIYTVLVDYQTTPYTIPNKIIGTWALLIGFLTCFINFLIYGFIGLRLKMFYTV